MLREFGLIIATGLAVSACGESSSAQSNAEPVEASNRAQIEQIVHDYIVENPEVIEEALIELQRRARAREMQDFQSLVESHSDRVFNDERDPVIGAANASVTVVEFFDYKCGYCRMSNQWVANALNEYDGQINFIMKEFPVLGPESETAAKAALAVWNQGEDKYIAFHNGLYAAGNPLNMDRIEQVAVENNVDVDRMREDMQSAEVEQHINDVRSLARQIGINGTPFFIINNEVVPGANVDRVQELVEAALAE